MAIIKPYKGIFPRIHPSVYMSENVVVVGDVEIGEDSSLWFGTVVRGCQLHSYRKGNKHPR